MKSSPAPTDAVRPDAPATDIVIRLTRCPGCQSLDLLTVKTATLHGTKFKFRYIECRACGHKFRGWLK